MESGFLEPSCFIPYRPDFRDTRYLFGDAERSESIGSIQVEIVLSLVECLPLSFSFGVICKHTADQDQNPAK